MGFQISEYGSSTLHELIWIQQFKIPSTDPILRLHEILNSIHPAKANRLQSIPPAT
jgi:hypothetical protein